ncbi:hypothetical protein REPUB_Repub18cG0007300 [Reevesia pubescens]
MIPKCFNFQSFVVMSVDGRGVEATSSELQTTPSYVAEESKPYIEEAISHTQMQKGMFLKTQI